MDRDTFFILDHVNTLYISKTAVLDLWVVTSLGPKRPFHRGRLRPSENTDIYIAKGVSHKTTPHLFGIMINKRVIYLKGKTYKSPS